MSDPRIPDRFVALDELARGEGEIRILARDSLLQREVVLRLPAPELARTWPDADTRAAELRSARAMAQVQHPGVVRLLDVIDTPDGALVVLEPVPGETLAEATARSGQLDAESVRAIGAGVADALAAVHAKGVVHRGVSASSIYLRGTDTPCLGGFVFAKFVDREGGQSSIQFSGRDAAECVALPPHPAPEQLGRAAADGRADVFALGWVLYEALTGKSPYPRDLEPEAWREPADPSTLAPGVPRALASALLRALRKSPAQRFADAGAFRDALQAAAPAPAGSPADASARGVTGTPRSRIVPLLAGFGVAAAAVALVFVLRDRGIVAQGDGTRGLAATDTGSGPVGDEYGSGFRTARALLVGISDYEGTGWPSLNNAERDVEALADRLAAMAPHDPWQVDVLKGRQATKRAIKDALAKLAMDTQDPESRVFVYFAGHGVRDELSAEHGYVVPADARPKDEDLGRESYLLHQDGFDKFFSSTRAKHVLLALDCCYGGGVTAVRGGETGPSDVLLTRKAHLVFASSVRTQTALDGEIGQHSPFAQAFLDELGDQQKSVVTSFDLAARITSALKKFDRVPNLGYRSQGGGDGQFVFFTRTP